MPLPNPTPTLLRVHEHSHSLYLLPRHPPASPPLPLASITITVTVTVVVVVERTKKKQKHVRTTDKERGLLHAFEEEWEAAYARFQRAAATHESLLHARQAKQVDVLTDVLDRALAVPPQYSHDLLAMRWVQRSLFDAGKLMEASVLGKEAGEAEAAEMEEALGRVERDNVARMTTLYRRWGLGRGFRVWGRGVEGCGD